jgi:hypothetical protein
MPKQTLQERYVAALEARGCRKVVAKTRKYVTLTRNMVDGKPTYYFVGKSGAVRYGRNATDSFAASDKFKAALLGDAK